MIDRTLFEPLREMSGWFPVVSLTGPRQSGKSTLIREAFPDYTYVNLENPDTLAAALADPVGFISNRPERLIIDEAQHAPELFSMIQVASDERGSVGQYVLSGSQNFLLMKNITQSLAGRVGMLKLLPLSFQEARPAGVDLRTFAVRGGYPRLYDAGIPSSIFYENYLSTYVSRDAGDLLNVRDLSSFRRMLGLCAAQVGSLVTYARLADDTGVSAATVKSWLSILESSYIVCLLQPYHANIKKRLTKSPKLYFCDTGLLCHLLNIRTVEDLLAHPLRGEVFENLVVSERLKYHFNRKETPELYFYRDDSKREIDLIDCTDSRNASAYELKSGETYRSSFGRHLRTVGDELGIAPENRFVVYMGSERISDKGIEVLPASEFLQQA